MTTEQLTEQKSCGDAAPCGALSRIARVLAAAATVFVVFSFEGCGEYDEPPEITKQAIKFDEVPEMVRTAASNAIPGVKLNEAWKNLGRGGKLHSYEIRGKNAADGKTREVRVSLTGEILETE